MKDSDATAKAHKSQNIVWSAHKISAGARAESQGHRGAVVWLTGLPASGKSTLAFELERRLFTQGLRAYVLDGDNLRHGLSSDLGFSADDRAENIRRAGEVAALIADAGVICIAAFVSPFADGRTRARESSSDCFFEVYIKASPEVCAQRDPKKLYEKARQGLIKDLTGFNAPYDVPQAPDLILDTETLSVQQAADLLERNILLWSRIS